MILQKYEYVSGIFACLFYYEVEREERVIMCE